jgi:hypothetical protein
MSTFPSSGDGRKEFLAGQPLFCPKCHAPLDVSRGRRSHGLAPVWLRLIVLVLLLAVLATPVVAAYYLRARVLDDASAAARNYLDHLRAKETKAAKDMMDERARDLPNTLSLQEILALDKAGYQLTGASRNGALVNVQVTCIVPDDAKLPKLPLAVDKNPRITLVLDQIDGSKWQVDGVALWPKTGTNALPNFGDLKPAVPSMGTSAPPGGAAKKSKKIAEK